MIPSRAHFIWLGREFPWIFGAGIRSASTHGGFEKVTLHYEDDLSNTPGFQAVAGIEGVETKKIDLEELFTGIEPRGKELFQL